jgi:DNA repair protein RadA/Sms
MKARTQFVCQQCGTSYAKWVGQCANCGTWNSLVEQVQERNVEKKSALEKGKLSGKKLDFVKLNTVIPSDAKARDRKSVV